MVQLRPVSARPELVVGEPHQPRVEAPDGTQLGVSAGPVWRERVLYALPLNGQGSGPVQLARAGLVQGDQNLLGDPSNNVIGGDSPVWVHRMLYAARTEDTRI